MSKIDNDASLEEAACSSQLGQSTQNLEKFKFKFRFGPTLCAVGIALILVLGLAKWVYKDESLEVNFEPEILPKERVWPKISFKTSPQLYLNLQGPQAKDFEQYVTKALNMHGFQLVATPSEAEGIVQVAIFHLGQADLAKCRLAVNKGYAAKVNLRGTSCLAFLCDLLLVEREIAQERNEQQTNLAIISNRHIKGSVQERFGVVWPKSSLTGLPSILALKSADELTKIVMERFGRKTRPKE